MKQRFITFVRIEYADHNRSVYEMPASLGELSQEELALIAKAVYWGRYLPPQSVYVYVSYRGRIIRASEYCTPESEARYA